MKKYIREESIYEEEGFADAAENVPEDAAVSTAEDAVIDSVNVEAEDSAS